MKHVSRIRRWLASMIVAGGYCCIARAADLPWAGPLNNLQENLTGTVAKVIGVIALAVAGGMLAFGGELNDFTKRILMVVLALSVMLMATQFMTGLFPDAGAQ